MRQPRVPPWWAHPVSGLAVFALPGLLLAFFTPPDRFLAMWGAPKYVGLGDVIRALVALAAFAAGSLWWRFVQRPDASGSVAELDDGRLLSAFRVLSRIALLSYGMWALVGVQRGVTLSQIQSAMLGEPGAVFVFKGLLAPVAGITTLTQTAMVAAAIAGLLIRRGHRRPVIGPLAALSALAVLRAYLLSERLAILEIGVPLLLAWLLTPSDAAPARRERRLGVALVPLIYVAVAAALFAAFEYNRSWVYYRNFSDVGYATFARERFLGYYATSANNGALATRWQSGPRPAPFTMQWLDEMPVLGLAVDLYGDRVPLGDLLAGGANPEFNTEGALNAPAVDWGTSGAVLVWFVGGAAFAVVFGRVRRGDAAYLPLYTVAYVGIIESGRYFYWGTGRAVVPLVAGVLVARHLRQGPAAAGAVGAPPLARSGIVG